MKLKDRNGNIITFKDMSVIEDKINVLKKWTKDNPTKELAAKITSLLASETFASLFIEGEVSSRRNIKKSFKSATQKLVDGREAKIVDDFIGAYGYATKPKEFTLSNLFTLYSIASRNGLDHDSALKDGTMYRHEQVYIKSNKMKGDFEGFKPETIQESLNDLFDYLNNSSDDIFFKAVLGHIYFEMIHPYFDFNGRTGRFIPMWLFANNNKLNEMMYFATAMNNYRKQYLALFNKYIDSRTYQVDIDKMVNGILDLLILNQKQYIWIKNLEKKFLARTNKSFSNIQKDFIWMLMIKSEISADNTGWFKLTESDKSFIELELQAPLFSKETIKLRDAKIIKISNDKPRKYHLNKYDLLK